MVSRSTPPSASDVVSVDSKSTTAKKIETAKNDIKILSSGLNQYKKDHLNYPLVLNALSSYTKDPWGRDYIYYTVGDSEYILWSMGPDAVSPDDDFTYDPQPK